MNEDAMHILSDRLTVLKKAMSRLPQYQSGDDPDDVIEQAILMFDRINDDKDC